MTGFRDMSVGVTLILINTRNIFIWDLVELYEKSYRIQYVDKIGNLRFFSKLKIYDWFMGISIRDFFGSKPKHYKK